MLAQTVSTVVAMRDHMRSKDARIERAQADVKNPLGQLHAARLLTRVLVCLPDAEFKLLSFIIGRTLFFGEHSRYFTYRFLRYGDQLSVGLGKSESRLREILMSLEQRGVVSIDRSMQHTHGLRIEANANWEPRAEMIPVPKRLKDKATHTSSSDAFNDGWEDAEVPQDSVGGSPSFPVEGSPSFPADIREELKEELFKEEHSFRLASQPAARSAQEFDLNEGWEEQAETPQPASPQKKSNPPVALVPLQSTTAEKIMADALARTHRRLVRAEQRLNPGALQDTFRGAYEDAFAGRAAPAFIPWTRRELGMINQTLIRRWEGSTEEAHAFVSWVVRNWAVVTQQRWGWAKKMSVPDFPTFDFFAKQWRSFLAEFHREKSGDFVKTLTTNEEREMFRLTRKEGLTEDQARMRLAEDRVTAKLRDELRQQNEKAQATFRKAQIVEAAARKMADSAGVPHPKSEAARLARLEENRKKIEEARERYAADPVPVPPEFDFSNIKEWE